MQQGFGTLVIGEVGGQDQDTQQQAQHVYRDMPFASFDLFASVIATGPLFSVVLTDWLSRIAALGCEFLPSAIRSSVLNAIFIHSQIPSRRQIRK